MRTKKVLWVVLVAVGVACAFYGCSKLFKKGKPAPAPISVETPPSTAVETPPTETTPPPQPSPYTPTKLDILKQLDDCLGASEKTLGWDNIYCSVSLEKDVELFTALQPSYAAGTPERNFVDTSITELNNIKAYLDEKISKAEGVDPTGADAQAKKKKIADIRARVRAMIAGPAPKKEPVPEWKGDLMKKKWEERGDMLKKKWAERGKKK